MRVRSRSVGPRIHDEDGAVLVFVAISLIVLLGMLVLTFDLGRSVAIKRQMVNGTDAAALAAAQECALGHGVGLAEAAAAEMLAANKSEAEVTGVEAPQCEVGTLSSGAKTVTVNTTTPVSYYFAPIFGMDSGTVDATATAIWGPVDRARPIPVTVNLQQLQGCQIPEITPPPGGAIGCELVYPKDALVEPRWGTLDLSQWNNPDAAPCDVDADTLKGQIEAGGWPETLPLNPGPPGGGFGFTPDCLDNGLSDSVWMSMVGRILTFPVMDIPTSTGQGCTGDTPGCQIDTANIVAYVTLRVVSHVNDGSTIRLQVEWLGPSTKPSGSVGTGPDYGDRTTRLVR